MKRIILIVLTFSTLSVLGQQDPQFTQNFANKLYNNPGYAGMNGAICATVIGRQQWLGFDGAPRTGLISIHSPIKLPIETSLINLGVGFTAANDIIGPLNTNFFKFQTEPENNFDENSTNNYSVNLVNLKQMNFSHWAQSLIFIKKKYLFW